MCLKTEFSYVKGLEIQSHKKTHWPQLLPPLTWYETNPAVTVSGKTHTVAKYYKL